MRRIFTIMAALLLSVLSLDARTVPVRDFSSIKAGGVFDITLRQSDKYSVEVDASSDYDPYVSVTVLGRTLVLSLRPTPRGFKPTSKSYLKVTVSVPELTSVELSGSSRLECFSDFSTKGRFELEVSGAASVTGLDVTAGSVDVEVSGASSLKSSSFEGKRVDIEVSGAGKASMYARGDFVDFDLSGASSLDARVSGGNVNVDASGACKLKLDCSDVSSARFETSGSVQLTATGRKIDALDIESSGASKVDASDLAAAHVNIESGSGSRVEVRVSEHLEVSASAASKVGYYLTSQSARVVARASAAATVTRRN